MIDLHSHTAFSDGALIPAELIRRAAVRGITALGITDHGDSSNMDFIIPRMVKIAEELNSILDIKMIPGIELTHVPPELIKAGVDKARSLGAKIVLVHGETIVEPVAPGTNQAAIEAGADVLAHPGFITEEEVLLAKKKGVLIEITARHGHSLTNGHVAKLAKKLDAKMVLNTDTHSPDNLIDSATALKVALGAGLSKDDFIKMQENAAGFIGR